MFTFGFYNSYNGDRKYDSEQLSSIFDGIIEDGVFANVGEKFAVAPGAGMQIIVKTGRAWFKHTWNLNDSWMVLDIDPADSLRSRIDSVVLEINSNTLVRENSIKIVKGTLGSSPIAPTMIHGDGVDQYRLADITVGPGISTIGESNISNKVGLDETPYVVAPIKSIDVSYLYNEWDNSFNKWLEDTDASFQEWFSNIQAQLAGDVAANLQNQIDRCVKFEDKATIDDIKHSNPNKWTDSKDLSEYVSSRPFNNLGDIVVSLNNIEKLTDGEYLLMNGRSNAFGSLDNVPIFYKEHYIPAIIDEFEYKYVYNASNFSLYSGSMVVQDNYVFLSDSSTSRVYQYDVIQKEIKQIYFPTYSVYSIIGIFPCKDSIVAFYAVRQSSSAYILCPNIISYDGSIIQERTYSISLGSRTSPTDFIFCGISDDGYYIYRINSYFYSTLDGISWQVSTSSFGSRIVGDRLNLLHRQVYTSDDRDFIYAFNTSSNSTTIYKVNYKTGIKENEVIFPNGLYMLDSTEKSIYISGRICSITSNGSSQYCTVWHMNNSAIVIDKNIELNNSASNRPAVIIGVAELKDKYIVYINIYLGSTTKDLFAVYIDKITLNISYKNFQIIDDTSDNAFLNNIYIGELEEEPSILYTRFSLTEQDGKVAGINLETVKPLYSLNYIHISGFTKQQITDNRFNSRIVLNYGKKNIVFADFQQADSSNSYTLCSATFDDDTYNLVPLSDINYIKSK